MENINHYINDGANWQAQAVLAIIRGTHERIADEFGFDTLRREYRTKVEVGRYENCREQGYVFGLYYDFDFIKYYAVYEHRNSDRIHILTSTDDTMNTPTPTEMFGPNRGKYDTDANFENGCVEKTARWILNDMESTLQKYILNKDIDIHSKETEDN